MEAKTMSPICSRPRSLRPSAAPGDSEANRRSAPGHRNRRQYRPASHPLRASAQQGTRGVRRCQQALVTTPGEEAERRQHLTRLSEGIEALPKEIRVVYVMCEIEDISGREAARALAISEGTIWRRMYAAREFLRRVISESRMIGSRHCPPAISLSRAFSRRHEAREDTGTPQARRCLPSLPGHVGRLGTAPRSRSSASRGFGPRFGAGTGADRAAPLVSSGPSNPPPAHNMGSSLGRRAAAFSSSRPGRRSRSRQFQRPAPAERHQRIRSTHIGAACIQSMLRYSRWKVRSPMRSSDCRKVVSPSTLNRSIPASDFGLWLATPRSKCAGPLSG